MESKIESGDIDDDMSPEVNRSSRLSFAVEKREEISGKYIGIKECVSKDDKFRKKTYYVISGSDPQGNFQISRRFKEFYLLRNVLIGCWPGFYIPKIPSKQTIVTFT